MKKQLNTFFLNRIVYKEYRPFTAIEVNGTLIPLKSEDEIVTILEKNKEEKITLQVVNKEDGHEHYYMFERYEVLVRYKYGRIITLAIVTILLALLLCPAFKATSTTNVDMHFGMFLGCLALSAYSVYSYTFVRAYSIMGGSIARHAKQYGLEIVSGRGLGFHTRPKESKS